MTRQLPYSPEAEQGVLGCILLDPKQCIGECVEKFKGASGVFHDLRHRCIYETLVEMYDSQAAIDLITLQQVLKDKGRLDEVGGLLYLSELPDKVPSSSNLSYYTSIVQEKYILRKTLEVCNDVINRIYTSTDEVDAIMDGVERDILGVSQSRVAESSTTIKELVKGAINRIEEYHQNQGKPMGLSTGFIDFDRMTGGLRNGDMIVLAARPSMGKTSLAMNIAEHVAVEQRIPVGVFSLEMTDESLVERMVCCRARVNLRDVVVGNLMEKDFPKLTVAASKIANAPLHIDDASGISILTLRAKARRMWQQHGIKLFVIDYLQLLHSTNSKANNRQQEIADISNGIKSLAKELNVPIIVLSQLNRELEKDKDRKPRLSDLRESGSIEQDADLVMMLYKPVREDDDDGPPMETEAIPVNLLIAKQRNGPTGDVNLTFFKTYTRFENAAKIGADV